MSNLKKNTYLSFITSKPAEQKLLLTIRTRFSILITEFNVSFILKTIVNKCI